MSRSALTDPTDLLGRWRLDRDIDDRAAAEQHRVEGVLTLELVAPGRVRWAETGRWRRPTGDVDVRRELWLVDEPDVGWWVRFDDDRDFHPWSPGEPVVHPCAPDTYRGVVTGTAEAWTVVWEVSGPRKDYTMTTRLTRPAD